MKLTVEQFVTVVRALPLSTKQAEAAEAAFAASAPNELPKELIRCEVLTEYQARLILAGRGADLVVGRYVLLAELGAGGMGTMYAWKADAKEESAVCKGHKGKVNAAGVTNDGARGVSAGEDGTVRVWDATTGKELHQYKHDARHALYSADAWDLFGDEGPPVRPTY